MECPRDLVDMRELVGPDETMLSVCDTCGGVWIDSAELNRLLLHNDLQGLESMGGKVNLDDLSERCPKDQVDLVVIEGGEKSDPLRYAYCEVCGGIWLDIEVEEDAEIQAIEREIISFFQRFRTSPGSMRSARP